MESSCDMWYLGAYQSLTGCGVLSWMLQGRIVEPLCDFHKDEVRALGETHSLPKELVNRHPFPGKIMWSIMCHSRDMPSAVHRSRVGNSCYLSEFSTHLWRLLLNKHTPLTHSHVLSHLSAVVPHRCLYGATHQQRGERLSPSVDRTWLSLSHCSPNLLSWSPGREGFFIRYCLCF